MAELQVLRNLRRIKAFRQACNFRPELPYLFKKLIPASPGGQRRHPEPVRMPPAQIQCLRPDGSGGSQYRNLLHHSIFPRFPVHIPLSIKSGKYS